MLASQGMTTKDIEYNIHACKMPLATAKRAENMLQLLVLPISVGVYKTTFYSNNRYLNFIYSYVGETAWYCSRNGCESAATSQQEYYFLGYVKLLFIV